MPNSPEIISGEPEDPRAVWDAVRREGQALEKLSDDVRNSRVLQAVGYGLEGPSMYPGLDLHNPNLRSSINDSIKELESRIANQQEDIEAS